MVNARLRWITPARVSLPKQRAFNLIFTPIHVTESKLRRAPESSLQLPRTPDRLNTPTGMRSLESPLKLPKRDYSKHLRPRKNHPYALQLGMAKSTHRRRSKKPAQLSRSEPTMSTRELDPSSAGVSTPKKSKSESHIGRELDMNRAFIDKIPLKGDPFPYDAGADRGGPSSSSRQAAKPTISYGSDGSPNFEYIRGSTKSITPEPRTPKHPVSTGKRSRDTVEEEENSNREDPDSLKDNDMWREIKRMRREMEGLHTVVRATKTIAEEANNNARESLSNNTSISSRLTVVESMVADPNMNPALVSLREAIREDIDSAFAGMSQHFDTLLQPPRQRSLWSRIRGLLRA